MSMIGGAYKMVKGIFKVSLSGAKCDGISKQCPKCGSIYHGICTTCATKEGMELLEEGFQDVKHSF